MSKVKSWTKIDLPHIEIDQFDALVLDKCDFSAILDKYGIEYMACQSGTFTHKMKCPLPTHAGGNERTASCYFSETENSFYCYGCNAHGTIVEFVRLYMGKPYYEALRWLASFAHITSENLEDLKNLPPKEKKDPEKTVMRFVYKMGILLRTFVEQHKGRRDYAKWSIWADKQFVRLDEMTDRLKDEDWEKVKAYHDKLEHYLKERQ